MPDKLLTQLKKELKDKRDCGNNEPAPFFSTDYYEISDGSLLVILQLYDYLCNSTKSFIPVKVSKDGKWMWGNRMDGMPYILVEGPEGSRQTLWLVTQWTVEASYPTLYRSEDGINWKEIPLPENRNVDCCFEYITKVCFDADKNIRLRFTGPWGKADSTFELNEDFLFHLKETRIIPETVANKLENLKLPECDILTEKNQFTNILKTALTEKEFSTYNHQILIYANKIKWWRTNLDNIALKPWWERLPDEKIEHGSCKFDSIEKGSWYRQENDSDIRFLYAPNRLIVIFPKQM